MHSPEDRRSQSAPRVLHTALVDICSQTQEALPFQGESANISGRGMRVKTSYLPEIGEELVCRFHHDQAEVLVEGLVAWRSEGEQGGEFGVKFTALDADSAELLRNLSPPQHARKRAPQAIDLPPSSATGADKTSAQSEPLPPAEDEDRLEPGSRVRLHIDGLGAPMKACVHRGTERKLRVGSNLEFLKLGRPLEVEALETDERKGALVDAVNVVINPTTNVPELVVQLRYDGVSQSPPPAGVAESNAQDQLAAPEAVADEPEHDRADAEPWEPAAQAVFSRLSGAVAGAGTIAKKAGGAISQTASSVRTTWASREKSAVRRTPSGSERVSGEGRRAPAAARPAARRTQAGSRRSQRVPAHLRSGIHDLGMSKKDSAARGSKQKMPAPQAEPPKKSKLLPGLLAGTAFVALAGGAVLLRGQGEPVAAVAPEPKKAEAAAIAQAKPPPVAKPPAAARPTGIVAEVPLFGPQAMAVKPAAPALSKSQVVEAERRAAAAAVPDQTWDEPAQAAAPTSKPFGRGKLYLPTVHRIRLDGAGEALAGAINADGFTIVVPGRKAMESGRAIEKRDKRIVGVKTSNNARGATVKFEFRGPVPPYQVRLRQDFIEFLVSAPEESVAAL